MNLPKPIQWLLYFPVTVITFFLSAYLLGLIFPTLIGWGFSLIGLLSSLFFDWDLLGAIDEILGHLVGENMYDLIKDRVLDLIALRISDFLSCIYAGVIASVGASMIAPKKLCENHVTIAAICFLLFFIFFSVSGWDKERNVYLSVWFVLCFFLGYLYLVSSISTYYSKAEVETEESTPSTAEMTAEENAQPSAVKVEDEIEQKVNDN